MAIINVKWCKYHGILTPASLTAYPTDLDENPYLVCGFPPGWDSGKCTARVYDLELWELDQMIETWQRRAFSRPLKRRTNLFNMMHWLLRKLFQRYSGIDSWYIQPLEMAVKFASEPVDEQMVGRTFMGPRATESAKIVLTKIKELL